jgi:maleylacetoacetate isomerase
MITLYSYYRSSAAYRVRIALNLKGVEYQQQTVNLLTSEESSADYQQINPQKLVPTLEHNGKRLYQSLAILEYLEEVFPDPGLLPVHASDRAFVRALSQMIASDIHPLNNLRVLKYLDNVMDSNKDSRDEWYRHWIIEGFSAIEQHLQKSSDGNYCFSDTVSMADIVLIPQVYNARRFNVDMSAFPLITSIEQNCLDLAAFSDAIPENQPDAK